MSGALERPSLSVRSSWIPSSFGDEVRQQSVQVDVSGLSALGHHCLRFLQELLDFPRRGFEQGRTIRRIEKDVQVAAVTLLLDGPYAYVPLSGRALQTIGQKISPNDSFHRLIATDNIECGADNMGIGGLILQPHAYGQGHLM
ncbi:hypothetical protein [Streptomyces sp. NBC_01724]|uniref:hypothetical protein n=1 Tax=Streptomyces sp. NBC_01724 TaxID=2975922 RepID=UPI003FCDE0ED